MILLGFASFYFFQLMILMKHRRHGREIDMLSSYKSVFNQVRNGVAGCNFEGALNTEIN